MFLLVAKIFQLSIGCIVIGAMAVTLTISFAALIYTGPLAPYLGNGANFALLGAGLMAAIGAFTYSIEGSIANPQDATAVVLGAAAVGIASTSTLAPDALFPTVLALLVAGCLVAGGVVFLAGLLHLGSLVRYTPYPVIAGFLAATGYLLVIGALTIVTGESVNLFNLGTVVRSTPLLYWLPWIGAGLALAVIVAFVPGDFAVPSALGLGAISFYALLAVEGISLEAALSKGILLGPFHPGNIENSFSWQFTQRIDWSEVFGAAPTLAAVAGLTLLGSLLNMTGLAITLKKVSETERDMRATGLANLASACAGGMPGYVILGESILARQMGLRGHAPGLVASFACGAAAFAGTEYLAYAPAGLMAMIVSYLGFDLLGNWLLSSWKRLSAYEYVIVVLIVLVTATFGFLEALALGTLAAAAIFVFTYSYGDVLRVRTTIADRRSWMERSDEEMEQLARVGHSCVILELSGFLFFGTADKVAKLATSEINSTSNIRYLILDFGRVTGLDASASYSLCEVVRAARLSGVEITLCGMSSKLERQLRLAFPKQQKIRFNGAVDSELEKIEDLLLKERSTGKHNSKPRLLSVISELEREFSDQPNLIQRVSLSVGQELLTHGASSEDLFVVAAGQLRAELPQGKRDRRIVSKFRAGALVGEVAYFARVPRKAWVVAETPSEVVRINLDELEKSRSENVMDFQKAATEVMARRIMRMRDYSRDVGSGSS